MPRSAYYIFFKGFGNYDSYYCYWRSYEIHSRLYVATAALHTQCANCILCKGDLIATAQVSKLICIQSSIQLKHAFEYFARFSHSFDNITIYTYGWGAGTYTYRCADCANAMVLDILRNLSSCEIYAFTKGNVISKSNDDNDGYIFQE